jgi:hypothetical protein
MFIIYVVMGVFTVVASRKTIADRNGFDAFIFIVFCLLGWPVIHIVHFAERLDNGDL